MIKKSKIFHYTDKKSNKYVIHYLPLYYDNNKSKKYYFSIVRIIGTRHDLFEYYTDYYLPILFIHKLARVYHGLPYEVMVYLDKMLKQKALW
jgi:hypothetical protein